MSFQPAGRVPEPLVVRAGGDDVPPQRRRGVPYCFSNRFGGARPKQCQILCSVQRMAARGVPETVCESMSPTLFLRDLHVARWQTASTHRPPTLPLYSASAHRCVGIDLLKTPTVFYPDSERSPRTLRRLLQDGSRLDAQSVSVSRCTLPPRMGFICFKYKARTAPQSVQSRSGE